MYSSKILYTGAYAPKKVVTNFDLSQLVDTSDEWIQSRCGVVSRHFSDGENTSDLAANAAKVILEKGNIDPLTVDLIIVATISGDYLTPSTACLVQAKIGAKKAIAFDVSAACSGFIYALSIADKFIKNGVYKNALVIGAEVLSKHMDYTDRTTCVLFGDGAAGVFLERSDKGGILAEDLGSNGEKGMYLTAGCIPPANAYYEAGENTERYIKMDGRGVFEFATRQTPKCLAALAEKSGVPLTELEYVIPHQANYRIIEIISRKTKIPMEKFYLNMAEYGNTSSASIPIALNEAVEKGLIKAGDKVALAGFGGGLTWGAVLVEM